MKSGDSSQFFSQDVLGLTEDEGKRRKQKQNARGSRRFGARGRRLTSLRKELGVNGLEVLLVHHAAWTLLGS